MPRPVAKTRATTCLNRQLRRAQQAREVRALLDQLLALAPPLIVAQPRRGIALIQTCGANTDAFDECTTLGQFGAEGGRGVHQTWAHVRDCSAEIAVWSNAEVHRLVAQGAPQIMPNGMEARTSPAANGQAFCPAWPRDPRRSIAADVRNPFTSRRSARGSQMTRAGRNRNGCFGVSNGNERTFVIGNCQRQPSTHR